MRKIVIKCGCLISMFIISISVKANLSPVSPDPRVSQILPRHNIIFIDDISDKIASDSRFIEFINVEISFQTQFRSFSKEDKKLFLTSLNEKGVLVMSQLFTKYGIDFKKYVSTRTSLLTAIDKEYNLDKRSDRVRILKAAVAKLDPPTFAECLALWANDSNACTLLWYGNEQMFNWCMAIMMATYLMCLGSKFRI